MYFAVLRKYLSENWNWRFPAWDLGGVLFVFVVEVPTSKLINYKRKKKGREGDWIKKERTNKYFGMYEIWKGKDVKSLFINLEVS